MKPLLDENGMELKLGDTIEVLCDIQPGPGNDWQGGLISETGTLKYDGENYYIEWQQKAFIREGYYTAARIIDDNCALYKVKEMGKEVRDDAK